MTNEEPDIPGYRCKVMETRENGWGGIMVLAKVEISNLIQIKREQRNEAEMLFLQVTCGRSLMTIGIIYAPQENQVDRHQLDNIYQIMRDEIEKAKDEGHVVMIMGDLNCKVGKHIEGNTTEITKGGRRLLKMKEEMDMTILNAERNCQGLWTRTQKDIHTTKKSVIDYVLISEEHKGIVEKMEIDEAKEKTPYRDDSVFSERVYTDHNLITLRLNLDMKVKDIKKRIVITEDKLEEFEKETDKGNLTEIWMDENLTPQEKYTKWDSEVIKKAMKVFGREQGKNVELKEIRMLREQRRILKKKIQNQRNKNEVNMINRRRRMIKDHMIKIKEQHKQQKVMNVAKSILKKGIFSSATV